jgi:hypothetical protein
MLHLVDLVEVEIRLHKVVDQEIQVDIHHQKETQEELLHNNLEQDLLEEVEEVQVHQVEMLDQEDHREDLEDLDQV